MHSNEIQYTFVNSATYINFYKLKKIVKNNWTNSTFNFIQVPFNFEAIQREHASRSHLPINLNLPPIVVTSPPSPPSVQSESRKNPETKSGEDLSENPRRKPSVARVGGTLQVLANFTQYCPPSHARTLFWNWTKAVKILRYLSLSL